MIIRQEHYSYTCRAESFSVLVQGSTKFIHDYRVWLQALCVELLPSGERAPEQLRRVPSCEGHLGGAAQRRRSDPAGADDGPGGRSQEPIGQEDLEEVLQPVAPAPPAVHFAVSTDVKLSRRLSLDF